MQISGNRVTLTLTDGGPGDADGVENGEIVDPGVVVRCCRCNAGTGSLSPAFGRWGYLVRLSVFGVFGLDGV